MFQVKFARDPARFEGDPVKWLSDAIDGEATRIAELVQRGATQYVLITNIPGTAHLDVGRIDRLNDLLRTKVPIPSECWWRGDVDRRLEGHPDLRWAYPELIGPGDLLKLLLEAGLSERVQDRSAAIAAFVAQSYEADREVRFKQVDIQNLLLDLFVDVPASIRVEADSRRKWYRERFLLASLSGQQPWFQFYGDVAIDADFFARETDEVTRGAASLLLLEAIQESMPRVVIEGGPGQGKSTLAQYLCQVHRMRLLRDTGALSQIPEAHRTGPIRLPFRVDLRDLGSWLSGGSPFSDEQASDAVTHPRTLEGLLAAQLERGSGGIGISVADIHSIARASALLLVLDGLDEVADVETRGAVVHEIERAATRLSATSVSLQLIVTSRPAAFVNTPSFSSTKFHKWELLPLTKPQITDYRDRWITARRLTSRDAKELRAVLSQRLDQPHMKDLARNPMQLAILLHLIHQRGVSLPDKRTELYDLYVDSYIARETEKSVVVMTHRPLLLSIHEYLGWLLHAEAEQPGADGRISDERLRETLREYLAAEGHSTEIVDELFGGVVQRVAALVSRKEGTWEFEVQPLREYFAASFLYRTAPYSRAGRERTGTRSDRFDAIATNFYWLNVARFFAGLADKGELAMLADRLKAMTEVGDFNHIAHPRLLAAMLLGDYVFIQEPRTSLEVVEFIFDQDRVRLLLPSLATGSSGTAISAPDANGRAAILAKAMSRILDGASSEFAEELAMLMRNNAPADEIADRWLQEWPLVPAHLREAWFSVGYRSGALSAISAEQLDGLGGDALLPSQVRNLVRSGRDAYVLGSEERLRRYVLHTLENPAGGLFPEPHRSALAAFALITDSSTYGIGLRPLDTPFLSALRRRRGQQEGRLPSLTEDNDEARRVSHVIETFNDAAARPLRHWASHLEGYTAVVEALRDGWGESKAAIEIAVFAAHVPADPSIEARVASALDDQIPLVERCRAARYRAGQPGWWAEMHGAARPDQVAFMAMLTVAWASPKTLVAVLESLTVHLGGLGEDDFARLDQSLRRIESARHHEEHLPKALTSIRDPRTAVLLMGRAAEKSRMAIFQSALRGYVGDDRGVVRAIAREALRQLTKPSQWSAVAAATSRAVSVGASVSIPPRLLRPADSVAMPRAVAMKIIEDLAAYPRGLVSVAEQSLRDPVAASSTPVFETAKSEDWFQA